ncbi:hypothetical protein LZ480_07035 [Solibacillus sp. MA9]|uniref:Uncharacterized protein n=1 Tax=Solibacillus palustris TaxID=2908203 RepID=A0ABS9UBX8_9BACL|nr:hypothetical protein [Solibacillus sp. MA9]MCH7321645.1 hypothetical protein [Solibacillus sp. MA9]
MKNIELHMQLFFLIELTGQVSARRISYNYGKIQVKNCLTFVQQTGHLVKEIYFFNFTGKAWSFK